MSSKYKIAVAEIAERLHQRNVAYGFKEYSEQRDPVHVIMLIMSELNEAFEEIRKGYGTTYRYFHCKNCKLDIHKQPDVLVKHSSTGPLTDAYDAVYACPRCKGPLAPEGFAVEFADALIRLLDAGAEYGIDYNYLVPHKMAYNDTRPPKHGKTM